MQLSKLEVTQNQRQTFLPLWTEVLTVLVKGFMALCAELG